MDLESQRSDEREVLASIYGGDDNFQVIDETTFQYKIEPDARSPRRFMLQIRWTESYPESEPEVNLDIFYNNHLRESAKDEVKRRILEEAAVWLGCAMTYTLFEFAKENVESLIPESSVTEMSSRSDERANTVVERNETRATRSDDSDKPRGWNWIDVVKHLCQVPPEVKTWKK